MTDTQQEILMIKNKIETLRALGLDKKPSVAQQIEWMENLIREKETLLAA